MLTSLPSNANLQGSAQITSSDALKTSWSVEPVAGAAAAPVTEIPCLIPCLFHVARGRGRRPDLHDLHHGPRHRHGHSSSFPSRVRSLWSRCRHPRCGPLHPSRGHQSSTTDYPPALRLCRRCRGSRLWPQSRHQVPLATSIRPPAPALEVPQPGPHGAVGQRRVRPNRHRLPTPSLVLTLRSGELGRTRTSRLSPPRLLSDRAA
mmetsp:Transcript_44518/g.96831  ORF Transcript_44518/g.96831 Transcript_44518/m.96831 type:complete len:205 (-) Transcript_44518:403-1017(-)